MSKPTQLSMYAFTLHLGNRLTLQPHSLCSSLSLNISFYFSNFVVKKRYILGHKKTFISKCSNNFSASVRKARGGRRK
jgi:hypothetical protein